MTSITVTFTLASGSLVVGPAPGVGSYVVTSEGITYPVFDYRIRYAADSDVHPGKTALAYTLEADTLTIPIYAQAASAAALATMRANFDAACAYPGTIAVNQDGVTRTYTDRLPAAPVWEQDPGMAVAHLLRGSVVIPVNPT
jgi:hypothetical protein